MPYARKTLVSLAGSPYYHVVARCVRGVWLWGLDGPSDSIRANTDSPSHSP